MSGLIRRQWMMCAIPIFFTLSLYGVPASGAAYLPFYADKRCVGGSDRAMISDVDWRVGYERSIHYLVGTIFGREEILGTATLVDRKGHFLTAAHVVEIDDPKSSKA